MNRREFVVGGVTSTAALGGSGSNIRTLVRSQQSDIRGMFPRLTQDRFVSAASGTPLASFAEGGLRRYMDFQRLGPSNGRADYFREVLSNIRGEFGSLIGATEDEIALVHCTKAGEQVVIDGLDPLGTGRNVVTNDFHFSGSLHNLVGLRRAGADIRIVKNHDWEVSLEDMAARIDENTCLVSITLLSNINGRIEQVRELAEIAHAHGAFLYADVIQAAGVVPFDVRELGIDFAATNAYKWLYGVHGSGFLYVRREHQGTVLPDKLFPGNIRFNYAPWSERAAGADDGFGYTAREDASRYEPGHVSYLGYCAAYEGIKFIKRLGMPSMLAHSVRLNRRVLDALDPDRYRCITPEVERSPIITFDATGSDLESKLRAANVVVALLGNGRVRISPAVYNTDEDIDVLVEALNADP